MNVNESNQIAERKIEQARVSQSRDLVLGGKYNSKKTQLTTLPESIGQLTQLRSLTLSHNRLVTLPDSLRRLTQLEELNLEDNQFAVLPELLIDLPQLRVLRVSRNRSLQLPDWLSELSELRRFYLSGNSSSILPESLDRLRQLAALDLSSMDLRALPDCVLGLRSLQELNLSANNIQSLPDSIDQLTSLVDLHCYDNELSSLPNGFGRLLNLRSLQLGNNRFSEVPAVLKELSKLEELHLHQNLLDAIPPWIDQLRSLRDLNLHANNITDLPHQLGSLQGLEGLHLGRAFGGNPLFSLPLCIRRLTNLKQLSLGGCHLESLPDWLGELNALTMLELSNSDHGNPLRAIPECVRHMRGLKYLEASFCEIATVPEWLGEIPELKNVSLNDNLIRDLPASLSAHIDSWSLSLSNNPLNPELAAAVKEGNEAIKRYLLELAKGVKRRYEAKLLILGDGNEGKTCVSRAVRGLPFQPQVTTRGVDVEQWKFEHPDYPTEADKEITLNLWDFEGQEINHQTHQFFLTTQSLYLIVFKCRDQFLMDRAEYWLDTIRARAPKAKAAIVITQCEERTPYVPQDKLQAQYGDLFVEGKWLFPVGCEDDSGITELRDLLKRCAADLEFMGHEWPETYSKAEQAIKATAETGTAHINRTQLHDTFRSCGIEQSIYGDVARSMSTLGVMTEFPDSPDLRNFIVLQPQWLTKAISEIMEDKKLASDKGEMTLRRMESIWDNKGYTGLFVTFHDCMKEFELCYDLEDASRSCLVPLRFGYREPNVPWTTGNGVRERRVEYKLNIRPPTGIMSRFIVKTHHMIATTVDNPKGVYWHNGVFLRTGTGPLASEALCEFDSDMRKLRIQVRAAFPQSLLEQIHGYVKAVFSFFSGLQPERSYGCIKFDDDTSQEIECQGLHTERRIFSEILNNQMLNCEHSFHKVDPQRLVFGFSSFGEFVLDKPGLRELLRAELDKKPQWAETFTQNIGKLLDWVEERRGEIDRLVRDQARLLPEIKQELDLKLHEYLGYTSQMLDDRDYTAAPGLISISTKDRSKWNPASYFKKTYFLTPYCESNGNIHPCEDGRVEFTKDREWWEKTAPWVARGTKLLSAGLQLAFAGMPLALGAQVFEAVKDDVKFMNELSKHLELQPVIHEAAGAREVFQRDFEADLRAIDKESKLMRAALTRFLEETAPTNYRARQWGSLSRVRMSDNSYRWICDDHRAN
jgi:internalin A